jgi:hypothetical protein
VKQQENPVEMRITAEGENGKRGGGLKRFFVTLLILFVIVYVSCWFAAGTDGMRSLVEKWLSDRVGMPVTVKKVRMSFPVGLVVKDLSSNDFKEDAAGLQVAELNLSPGVDTAWLVTLKQVRLVLVQDGEKSWMPRFFEKLGDLPTRNITEISRVTHGFRDRVAVSSEKVSIRWIDGAGGILAAVDDGAFRVEPVSLPVGEWHYHSLSIYRYEAPGLDGYSVRDMTREWIASDDNGYVELSRSGKSGHGPGSEFWEAK